VTAALDDGQRHALRAYGAAVATLTDVEKIIAGLPGITEGARFGNRTWFVGTTGKPKPKPIAWERPFSKADVKRFGDDPVPTGDILAVTVADLDDKQAVLQASTPGVFTIPHFDGYAAVLLQLPQVPKPALRALLVDAFLAAAPRALAEDYLAARRGRGPRR
jgi:hypothetical protein